MGKNIEIKARATDWERQDELAATLSGRKARILHQVDSFFERPRTRLKLREQSPGGAELIFYRRADQKEPGASRYRIVPVQDPAGLKERLAERLGVRGVVSKLRCVHLVGQTRIHVDRVEGLGDFLELEVVMAPGQSDEEGRHTARRLMERLEIHEADLISRAYIDLLSGTESSRRKA